MSPKNQSTYYGRTIPIWRTPIFSVGILPYESFSVPTSGIILADKIHCIPAERQYATWTA